MDLRAYLRVLRRRMWIPALLFVTTVAASGALSFISRPDYVATATVLAKSQTNGINFTDVANSNTVAHDVINQLRLNITATDLASHIQVSPGRNFLFGISITDPSAERATAIANAVAAQAVALFNQLAAPGSESANVQKEQSDLQEAYLTAATALVKFSQAHPDTVGGNGHPKDATVAAQAMLLQLNAQAASNAYNVFEQELSRAKVAGLAVSANSGASIVDEAAARVDASSRILKVAYAAVLALLTGAGIIFVLAQLDNAIRQPEEAEALVGAPVVGVIPRGNARVLGLAKG